MTDQTTETSAEVMSQSEIPFTELAEGIADYMQTYNPGYQTIFNALSTVAAAFVIEYGVLDETGNPVIDQELLENAKEAFVSNFLAAVLYGTEKFNSEQ
jgi:hypothetical protein